MVTLRLGPTPTGFVFDQSSEGWTLVHNPIFGSYPGELEFVDVLRPEDEGFIHRDELLARAATLGGGVGQHYAETMLASSASIPEELRKCYPVFTETRWQGKDGRIYLPVMSWDLDKRRWTLGFHWSEYLGWRGKLRLVRRRLPG